MHVVCCLTFSPLSKHLALASIFSFSARENSWREKEQKKTMHRNSSSFSLAYSVRAFCVCFYYSILVMCCASFIRNMGYFGSGDGDGGRQPDLTFFLLFHSVEGEALRKCRALFIIGSSCTSKDVIYLSFMVYICFVVDFDVFFTFTLDSRTFFLFFFRCRCSSATSLHRRLLLLLSPLLSFETPARCDMPISWLVSVLVVIICVAFAFVFMSV